MLYLIGGISRSGKSMVSKMLLKKRKVPYFPLDSAVMGFTGGLPEYGVNDKQFPEEIARGMWKFVKPLCENILYVGDDYTVEGEAILPVHADELSRINPGRIKACFLGYCDVNPETKINDIRTFSEGTNDWLLKEPDGAIERHVSGMTAYSRVIRDECEKYGLPFFDTSADFKRTVRAALRSLLS